MATFTAAPMSDEARRHAELLSYTHHVIATIAERCMHHMATGTCTPDETAHLHAALNRINDVADSLYAFDAAVSQRLGAPDQTSIYHLVLQSRP
ncbi:hypothetical protein AB0B07_33115 [Streptomyces sioyaensis]|uniref:hypothetical protein n=1 Tax=Streptomyces sioyaensis TaxID=67364 RepID=UPI0033EA6E5F